MNHENMKMTEVGWIPKDWEVKKVSDVATMPTATISSNSFDHKYYVGTDNMLSDKAGITLFEGTLNYNSVRQYKVGDTLISNIRPYLKKVWYADKNAGCSTDVIVFRAIENEVTPEYLHIALADDRYFKCVMDAPVGTKMPRGDKKVISDFCFALPTSPSEQRRIAEVLSDTDSLIASLSRTIEKKRLVKQGAMQQLLTGKTRLKGFSGEWVEKKLGDIADIRTGKRNGDENVIGGLYPFFVRSQEVLRINSYSYEGEAIIVPGEGGIGKIFHYVHGKFDYHQRVYKVSDFPSDICAKYVYYYMTQFFGDYALNQTAKATVDSLRLPTFQEFEISMPDSWNEQFAIANILTTMDNEIASLEAELQKYKALKQGMMQKLLTGQIRLV